MKEHDAISLRFWMGRFAVCSEVISDMPDWIAINSVVVLFIFCLDAPVLAIAIFIAWRGWLE